MASRSEASALRVFSPVPSAARCFSVAASSSVSSAASWSRHANGMMRRVRRVLGHSRRSMSTPRSSSRQPVFVIEIIVRRRHVMFLPRNSFRSAQIASTEETFPPSTSLLAGCGDLLGGARVAPECGKGVANPTAMPPAALCLTMSAQARRRQLSAVDMPVPPCRRRADDCRRLYDIVRRLVKSTTQIVPSGSISRSNYLKESH